MSGLGYPSLGKDPGPKTKKRPGQDTMEYSFSWKGSKTRNHGRDLGREAMGFPPYECTNKLKALPSLILCMWVVTSPKSEVNHETKFYLRIFYSTHVFRHLASNPLVVGIVSSIPTEGNFILN